MLDSNMTAIITVNFNILLADYEKISFFVSEPPLEIGLSVDKQKF